MFPRIARRIGIVAQTLAAGFLLACVFYESYNENLAGAWNMHRVKEPAAIRAFVLAAQMIHDWGMFAPNPMRNDGWWVVEGETRSGQRFDPFTGREPTWEKPDYAASQLDVSWRKYLSRINLQKNRAHRPYLCKYLTRRNHRETSGNERLARFRLYFLEERTLPPGTAEPFPVERKELWRHECFASAKASSLDR